MVLYSCTLVMVDGGASHVYCTAALFQLLVLLLFVLR